jgi:hypothetical protein
MKRLMMGLVVMLMVCSGVFGSDAVEPTSITFTNSRTEGMIPLPGDPTYYSGTTLVFSNCVCLGTGAVVQGLENVTIEVRVGSTTTNIAYVGATNAGATAWSASVTVPTNMTVGYIQTKLTDVNTNIFIYSWKTLRTKEPLD